jgi:hypothetical protein
MESLQEQLEIMVAESPSSDYDVEYAVTILDASLLIRAVC